MALLGAGVLAIWVDVAPGGEAEFNHWHTREHAFERVSVPGFERARRYVAISGSPKYFMLYETEAVETLSGPAYISRLNDPTPWTARVLPLVRNTNRTACRVTVSLGQGIGGVLATFRLAPVSGRGDELRAWLTGTALPAVANEPGVVGAHLCEADLSVTRVPTQERRLRGREDDVASWVVLVESTDTAPAETAYANLLSIDAILRHGAAEDTAQGIYRLLYCLPR
jgi:hypothetical protein